MRGHTPPHWIKKKHWTPPSVSHFKRGRGCADREPLRLAIWAREGLMVMRQQRKHPLRLMFQAREGLVVACRQKKHPFCLAFRAREGCVDRENPSVLQFEWERGWWCVDKRNPPLRLVFRAREGWMGCVDKRNTPSVLRFEQGRGVLTENPSVLQFEQGRGRKGWMQQHNEERDVSLHHVGSVVVSKLN